MTDLKELIEQEIDQYLEWPTADKGHVTTVSAKLFAEHMARLYADHITDAGIMVAPAVQGEPVAYISHTSEGDILGWERQFDTPSHTPLYTAPQPVDQQPDVTHLVEALEAALGSFDDWCDGQDPSDIADAIDTFPWVMQARSAIAAHHKGGEK